MELKLSKYVTVLFLLYAISFCAAKADKVTEYQNGQRTKMLNLRDACKLSNDIHCEKNKVTLKVGHCLTYDESSNTLTLDGCMYFEKVGHSISEPGFINLPDNISELNDYMCGPMNRRGLLCKDCIDGYGLSLTSINYKCSNCSHAWYGVPLYLIVEFVPVTLFFLLILFFRVHLTYAPMTCFIMYSQLFIFEAVTYRNPPFDWIIPEIDHSILFKLALTFHSVWNLDFIRYTVAPFCTSSNIQILHMTFLGYIPALYPFFLIILTWVYIKANDHNFRPLVWLRRLFHRGLPGLMRHCDPRSGIIDTFTSFFLLSYTRIIYQTSLVLNCTVIYALQDQVIVRSHAVNFDVSLKCGNTKHIFFVIPGLFILTVFNILPVLLLILYPFKVVRRCLSRCRLDSLALTAFLEKFYGCYRDGTDGGKDMRSLSGLYFTLRAVFPLHYYLLIYKLNIPFWSFVGFVFLATAVLIGYVKPYKKWYMNALDTLLLAFLSLACQLLSRDYFPAERTQTMILSMMPLFVIGLLLIIKGCTKFKSKVMRCCKTFCKLQQGRETDLEANNHVNDHSQPLLTPTSATVDIKHYESTKSHALISKPIVS